MQATELLICSGEYPEELNYIKLIYDGDPISRKSPRAFHRNGRINIIDPQSKELMALRTNTLNQLPDNFKTWHRSNGVFVYVDCYFKVPVSWSMKRKTIALKGEIGYTKVPDCDNIAKLFMDVIKGIVFDDDAQVVGLLITKRYHLDPRVEITIYKVGL